MNHQEEERSWREAEKWLIFATTMGMILLLMGARAYTKHDDIYASFKATGELLVSMPRDAVLTGRLCGKVIRFVIYVTTISWMLGLSMVPSMLTYIKQRARPWGIVDEDVDAAEIIGSDRYMEALGVMTANFVALHTYACCHGYVVAVTLESS
jgi:hypothetical protein